MLNYDQHQSALTIHTSHIKRQASSNQKTSKMSSYFSNSDLLDLMIDNLLNRTSAIPPLYPWDLDIQAMPAHPGLELANQVCQGAKMFSPIIKRPELKVSEVLCAPPPNFSVPPPMIPVRFSVPPPPIHPCQFKPANSAQGWIIEMPEDDNVEVPTVWEIGYWMGVPKTAKSILKNSDMDDSSETTKNVKFAKEAKLYFRIQLNSDDDLNSAKERPKSCKIPERYPYPSYPSAEAIKGFNQELKQATKNKRRDVKRTKRQTNNNKMAEASKQPQIFYNMVAEV